MSPFTVKDLEDENHDLGIEDEISEEQDHGESDNDEDADDELQQERENSDCATILEIEYEMTKEHSVLPAELNTARTAITKVCLKFLFLFSNSDINFSSKVLQCRFIFLLL